MQIKKLFSRLKLALLNALKHAASSPVVRRALHTFWQTYLAVFLAGIPLVVTALQEQGIKAGTAALIALATAALAAGFSAVKTAYVNWRSN